MASLPVSYATLNSRTLGAIVGLACALLFVTYMCGMLLTYRYAKNHPRGVNKKSGVTMQKAAPAFYSYIVLSSLIELSLASWLLIQYRYFGNSPNHKTTIAIRFNLFCCIWTFLTSGLYSILFLHPRWSELPFASLGSQMVWVSSTWLFWIVGAGLLEGALPTLMIRGKCGKVVFCGHIQGFFGLAVLTIIALTTGIIVLFYLAWLSMRRTREWVGEDSASIMKK